MVQHFGGMHLLMSFIGCVGSLMAESGLVDMLSCAFGGVDDMFTGNKCSWHFRALRLLVDRVIQNTVQEANDDDDTIQRKKHIYTENNFKITNNVQTNISIVYVVNICSEVY